MLNIIPRCKMNFQAYTLQKHPDWVCLQINARLSSVIQNVGIELICHVAISFLLLFKLLI